jgi:hypothetical protein
LDDRAGNDTGHTTHLCGMDRKTTYGAPILTIKMSRIIFNYFNLFLYRNNINRLSTIKNEKEGNKVYNSLLKE